MNLDLPEAVPLTAGARAAWERALGLWRVRLDDPEVRPGAAAVRGAPAWFAFPPAVTVDPRYLADRGLADELWSMFAHEIGHHVLAPSTRIDALKIRHQIARALQAALAVPPGERVVARLANLWCDLLVNTRLAQLQRSEPGAPLDPRDLGIVRLGRALYPAGARSDRVWWLSCRAYELLWRLPETTLCSAEPPAPPLAAVAPTREKPLDEYPERFREKERLLREARRAAALVATELAGATSASPLVDAALVADAVRTFQNDAVSGAALFGVLMAPYIREEQQSAEAPSASGDLGDCGADDGPPSAQELGRILADQRLRRDLPRHPAAAGHDDEAADATDDEARRAAGQRLTLAHTLRLYRDAGADAVLGAWYRTEAAPWVRPYTRPAPTRPAGGIPGPVETWQLGDDLADLDWPLSMRSGRVIPGVTTRRRTELDDEPLPAEHSIDLDLYIDSSGSMPHPQRGSPAVLAGTILALSVLRGGGRVRATSFSGPGEVAGMPRFGRDPVEIVSALATFFGRSTSFPLDLYDSRYAGLPAPTPESPRHVVVLSDDGLVSMFGRGNEPFAGVAGRVRRALTTGTLVLMDPRRLVSEPARADGYDVVYIDAMADAPDACAAIAERLHG